MSLGLDIKESQKALYEGRGPCTAHFIVTKHVKKYLLRGVAR